MPDHGLVQACLESYRSLASTPERLLTTDDLLSRSQDHTDLLATIAEAGHRLKMRVWIGRREQTRRVGEGTLGDLLDDGEKSAHLGIISPAVEELAEVDCIWYVRGKVGFLFEVEWTAMLGEPLLRKHARIPPDDGLIRFLVIAPERAELVRYKLARSPLLRAALDAGTWHIVKANHLRTFLAREPARPRRPRAVSRARPIGRALGGADGAVRGRFGRRLTAGALGYASTAAPQFERHDLGALQRRPTA